jgi:hypothetical protein
MHHQCFTGSRDTQNVRQQCLLSGCGNRSSMAEKALCVRQRWGRRTNPLRGKARAFEIEVTGQPQRLD